MGVREGVLGMGTRVPMKGFGEHRVAGDPAARRGGGVFGSSGHRRGHSGTCNAPTSPLTH